jgi:hypothetical protein
VKSSDPETNLSGALPLIALYLSRATYIHQQHKLVLVKQMKKVVSREKNLLNKEINTIQK